MWKNSQICEPKKIILLIKGKHLTKNFNLFYLLFFYWNQVSNGEFQIEFFQMLNLMDFCKHSNFVSKQSELNFEILNNFGRLHPKFFLIQVCAFIFQGKFRSLWRFDFNVISISINYHLPNRSVEGVHCVLIHIIFASHKRDFWKVPAKFST